MGRQRNLEGDEAMVTRFLLWCGAHLEPIGLASDAEMLAEGMDIEELHRLQAEKATYQWDANEENHGGFNRTVKMNLG